MFRTRTVETAKDRVGLAHDAGLSRISFLSVLAGAFAAYGAFALFASLFGGIASAAGSDFTVPRGNWQTAGAVGAVVLGLTLLCSYLFGGYVAGRMARRSGTSHGLFVFLLGILMAAVVGAFATTVAGTDAVRDSLRDTLGSIGVPSSAADLRTIASIGGVVALSSMLLGSLIGGRLGDRWHGKLLTRALDPNVGPAAETDRRDTPIEDHDDREIDLRDSSTVRDADSDTDIPRDEFVRATIGPLYSDEEQRNRTTSFDRPMNQSQRVAVEGLRNREIERFNPNRPF